MTSSVPLPGVRGQHDDQREGRHDQEDVGDHRQHLVGDAAEVGGGHPDQDREHGGEEAGHERDDQRLPGAVDQLGPDVLAERRSCRASASATAAATGANASRLGWRTEVNSCGTIASTQKIRKMTMPDDRPCGWTDRAHSPPPRRRAGGGRRGRGRGVDEQCGHCAHAFARRAGRARRSTKSQTSSATQHSDREQHEQRLHQRVVGVLHRVVEQVAQARVVEDVLDQDRAGDHEAERHREAGQVGQHGVARGVVEHDPSVGQTLGPTHPHVVLGQRGDHVVAHGQDPAADRR